MPATMAALDQHASVSITDEYGNIIYVNDKQCEISKYSRAELIGNNHRVLKSDVHDAAFFQDMWDTISHGKPWHGEICNRCKSGRLYWVESTIMPVLDKNGLPCQYVAIQTEITKTKLVEVGGRTEPNQLEQFGWIYNLYFLVQEALAEGDHAKAYLHLLQYAVNFFQAQSGSIAILEKPRDELLIVAEFGLRSHVAGTRVRSGESIYGRVLLGRRPLILHGIDETLQSDPRQDRRRDLADMSSICLPLIIGANVVGAIAINRRIRLGRFDDTDLKKGALLLHEVGLALNNVQLNVEQQARVTELRKMNEELQKAHGFMMQSEKLASIGQLAAGVAHEINNPIGYVYSNLGTLDKYLKDVFRMLEVYEQAEPGISDAELSEKVKNEKRMLEIAFIKEDLAALMKESKDGINRVKRIVQDLKDFAHIDALDEWLPADIHNGLDSTLNIVRNEIKYTAEVVKDYGDLPQVECLATQINQVFMNILVNAAQAIAERGQITIRTRRIGEEVAIAISDTGKGIAPEHISKIFDPFFTTKPVGKGTGLGLSVSYSIIQKHHGRIEVKSEVGKGTTFTVFLPISQPREAEAR